MKYYLIGIIHNTAPLLHIKQLLVYANCYETACDLVRNYSEDLVNEANGYKWKQFLNIIKLYNLTIINE